MNLFELIKTKIDNYFFSYKNEKRINSICKNLPSELYSLSLRVEMLLPICIELPYVDKNKKFLMIEELMKDILEEASNTKLNLKIEDTFALNECKEPIDIKIKGWIINYNSHIKSCNKNENQ